MLKAGGRILAPDPDETAGIPRGARLAVTRYRTVTKYDIASHMECILETGRTHQVRVHFSHRGHPVVGDPTYGGRKKAVRGFIPEQRVRAESLLDAMPRQALHAARLRFLHPVSREEISIESELPPDIRHLINQLEEMP